MISATNALVCTPIETAGREAARQPVNLIRAGRADPLILADAHRVGDPPLA